MSAYDDYAAVRDGNTGGRSRQTRAALNAATALFHFREHLPASLAKTRAQIVADCPDYRLVADVANVTKHKDLTRDTPEGMPLVKSAEDIDERVVVTRYKDDQGEYSDAQTYVFVNCSDGTSRDLDSALTNVLNYWGEKLKRQGIVKYKSRSPPENRNARFVPRSEAKAPNLEMLSGLRWTQKFQLMEFDSAKGSSAPIDLTGANLEFRIYKPRYSVDITATPPNGGEAIKYSIDLTEEQSLALAAIKTDAEREAFLRTIMVQHRNEISATISASLKSRREPK